MKTKHFVDALRMIRGSRRRLGRRRRRRRGRYACLYRGGSARCAGAGGEAFSGAGDGQDEGTECGADFIAPKSQTFAICGDTAVHAKCGEEFWKVVAG